MDEKDKNIIANKLMQIEHLTYEIRKIIYPDKPDMTNNSDKIHEIMDGTLSEISNTEYDDLLTEDDVTKLFNKNKK